MAMKEPYGFVEALLRHQRAGEHLTDLNRIIGDFRATPRDVGSGIYAEPGSSPNDFELRELPIPHEIPIRVGEMIYNLRASLDYTVRALSWHDTGFEPHGRWEQRLQFLIERTEEQFQRKRDVSLKGLSDAHVALVESYQPYTGCDWTGLLAELSNTDKHRHFAVLVGHFDPQAEWSTHATPKPEAEPDEAGFYDLRDLDIEILGTFDVAFMEPAQLVTETLEDLRAQVDHLLRRFWHEFTLRSL